MPRFCTAVSLSTSVSITPAPPSSFMAFCVFTTGMGQASPIAFTSVVIVKMCIRDSANTTYGENTGVLALSKVYDPRVVRLAAIYAIIRCV